MESGGEGRVKSPSQGLSTAAGLTSEGGNAVGRWGVAGGSQVNVARGIGPSRRVDPAGEQPPPDSRNWDTRGFDDGSGEGAPDARRECPRPGVSSAKATAASKLRN